MGKETQKAYLLTTSPKSKTYPTDDYTQYYNEYKENDGDYTNRWSCGNNKSIQSGDRIFFIKLGEEPKGIVAAGTVIDKLINRKVVKGVFLLYDELPFVNIKFEHMFPQDEEETILLFSELEKMNRGLDDKQKWNPQISGVNIKEEVVDKLEKAWKRKVAEERKRSNDKNIANNIEFQPGRHHNNKETHTHYVSKAKEREIDLKHNQMSEKLYKALCKKYRKDKVASEHIFGYKRNRIDIVLEKNKRNVIFYEIKTSPEAKKCIREAIGQLLEYTFWPENPKWKDKVKELVIVGEKTMDNHCKNYVKCIDKKLIGISLSYKTLNELIGKA